MNISMQKISLIKRLWIYQKERFPVLKHGILIGSFSFCSVCLSSLLRQNNIWPDIQTSLTAFFCLFLFFLELRILDEFKDAEIDAKFRPERPVPRGLISLGELKFIGMLSVLLQLVLTYYLNYKLIFLLVLTWVYMAAMSVEFFIGNWIKKRPLTYLWTHMLIMPLIDFFATACDWLTFSNNPPSGLIGFLVVSFFNGVVIEIGRKTWAPEQERLGVESYSKEWGIRPSIVLWWMAMGLAFVFACMLAFQINFFYPVFIILSVLLGFLLYLGYSFIKKPTLKKSKMLENFSGLWVAMLYLILGILPMGVRLWIN
ncbi:MAG: UbiA family prenyltransferase [Gammaproteobacteria bacterium]